MTTGRDDLMKYEISSQIDDDAELTDMADMAWKTLIKQEVMSCGECQVTNTCEGGHSSNQNCSFGSSLTHPVLQHVVSVTDCSLTFKIEIAGWASVVNGEMFQPYVNISKAEALNWLSLLGYQPESSFQIDNDRSDVFKPENMLTIDDTSELFYYPATSNCSAVAADVQANTLSGPIGEVSDLQTELHSRPIKLHNCYVELERCDHKQNPLFGESSADYNNKVNKLEMRRSSRLLQKSCNNIESDKYLCENVNENEISGKLQVIEVRTTGDGSAIIDGPIITDVYSLSDEQAACDVATLKIGVNDCDLSGGVALDTSQAAGSGIQTPTGLTDDKDDGMVTSDKRRNVESTKENNNVTNAMPNTVGENECSESNAKGNCSRDTHSQTVSAHQLKKNANLRRYKVPYRGDGPFRCERCSYRTVSKANLLLHNKKHFAGEKIVCEYCDYTTNSTNSFKRHRRTHTKAILKSDDTRKRVKCTYSMCSFTCSSPAHLKMHVLVHTGDRPHKCIHCPYTAARATNLRKHILKLHTKGQIYSCEHCSFTSKIWCEMCTHVKEHTQPFQCSYPNCGYKSAVQNVLQKHEMTHTGHRPHKCSICSYAARSLTRLRTHILTHTKERPYSCEVCPYTSAQVGAMTTHIALKHSVDKPFKCTYPNCSYKTALERYLRVHVKHVHTGEGLVSYKCTFCSFSTYDRSYLPIHIRTHTKVKPYKCAVCPYAANTNGTLQLHMMIHKKEQFYHCGHCTYTSVNKYSVRQHTKLRHT